MYMLLLEIFCLFLPVKKRRQLWELGPKYKQLRAKHWLYWN